MENDGGINDPWATLEEVIEGNYIKTQRYSPLPYSASSVLVTKNSSAPVMPGDTLMLRDGYHGSIFYRGAYMEDYLTIMAEPGHQPIIGNIQLSAARRFIFDGIVFSPEAADTFYTSTLFYLESHGYHGPSGHIILRNCTLYGTSDNSNWGIAEWNEVGSCIVIKGDSTLIENNVCINIDEGINLSGDHSQAINNQIINFAGDGMRGQGDYLLFENNVIKNCYNVNGNHDDAFQSFTTDPTDTIRNITLRGNTIINYEDPNQPFRGSLQGIGCFDGPYKDWVIENNLVLVNHYHGISLYGAYDCVIQNNTVLDRDLVNQPNGTWLRITNHKDGSPGSNNLVQNNVVTGLSLNSSVTSYNNEAVTNYDDFVNGDEINFNLNSTSTLVNSGRVTDAPERDLLGAYRLEDGMIDIGAIEHNEQVSCESLDWIITKNLGNSGTKRINGAISIPKASLVLPFTEHQLHFSSFFEVQGIFEIPVSTELSLFNNACGE